MLHVDRVDIFQRVLVFEITYGNMSDNDTGLGGVLTDAKQLSCLREGAWENIFVVLICGPKHGQFWLKKHRASSVDQFKKSP